MLWWIAAVCPLYDPAQPSFPFLLLLADAEDPQAPPPPRWPIPPSLTTDDHQNACFPSTLHTNCVSYTIKISVFLRFSTISSYPSTYNSLCLSCFDLLNNKSTNHISTSHIFAVLFVCYLMTKKSTHIPQLMSKSPDSHNNKKIVSFIVEREEYPKAADIVLTNYE